MGIDETIYFSNRIEVLYEVFRDFLLKDLSPFSFPVVIIPNRTIKRYITLQLAKEKNAIASGIDFLLPEDFSLFFSCTNIPSIFDIEMGLQSLIPSLLEEGQEIFSPLIRYLEGNIATCSERINSFCRDLASLFYLYGLYDMKRMEDWKESWQGTLWKRLFQKNGWTYPFEAFSKDQTIKEKRVIHLFSLSFIHPLTLEVFRKVSHTLTHYVLSPCLYFWEDILSERDRWKLAKPLSMINIEQQDQEQIDQYLEDRNSLLANLGKVGQQYMKILNREEVITKELYHHSEENRSLLCTLQNQLLFLKNPSNSDPIPIKSEDRSIQFHVVHSKWREIEVLYNWLLDRFSSDSELRLGEVRIYAPDINEYESYIHLVFGEGSLPYSIGNLRLSNQSSFARAVTLLLSLLGSSWELDQMKQLLSYPSFQQKNRLSEEEIGSLIKWFEKANISWGIDASHRKQCLFMEEDQNLYYQTWQHGCDRLMSSFIFARQDFDISCDFAAPICTIGSSDVSLLIKWQDLFSRLKLDHEYVQSTLYVTLEEAAKFFEGLVERYFLIDEQNSHEFSAYRSFQKTIEQFFQANFKLKEQRVLFSSLIDYLKKSFEKPLITYKGNLVDSIHFSSLQNGSITPSSVICFLGMNENFPVLDKEHPLNQLKKCYIPTKNEQSRFLFLEGILCARAVLYLSFVGFSADGKEEVSSILLQELESYLNRAFVFSDGTTISSKVRYFHPLLPFDRRVFEKNALRNISPNLFKLAKVAHGRKKKNSIRFVSWQKEQTMLTAIPEKQTISLATLENFSLNPIRFYFQEVLHIYFDRERKIQERITLSPLDRYLVREKALRDSRNRVLSFFEKEGWFHEGMGGKSLQEEIKGEITHIERVLDKYGIAKDQMFSFEMHKNCSRPCKISPMRWEIPPVTIDLQDNTVQIVGSLSFVSEKGLVFLHDTSLSGIVRSWPRFLLSMLLPQTICPHFISAKDGKMFVCEEIDPKEDLRRYLSYFFRAKKNPSPLIKEWIRPLLFEEVEEMKEAINRIYERLEEIEDPYLFEAFSFSEQPDPLFLLEQWGYPLREVFDPLIKSGKDGRVPMSRF